jgi:hypothetical protein
MVFHASDPMAHPLLWIMLLSGCGEPAADVALPQKDDIASL